MRVPPLLVAAVAAGLAMATPAPAQDTTAEAIFAAGCFWCTESDFDTVDGVLETISGYTGGRVDHPTYAQVSAGGTGHAEALKVVYDPARVGYAELLRVFWRNVDPFDSDGQFCDHGAQYRPALFPLTAAQRQAAEASRKAAEEALGKPVRVTIEEPGTFWPAEDYHQGYHDKNPVRYTFYRFTCGRDARLDEVWSGVPALALTPESPTPAP
jgi:peptide-methionine (S)-S-oxide reductase